MLDLFPISFSNDQVIRNLISTAILIVVAFAIRALALSAVRKVGLPTTDARRTWIVQIRNLTLTVIGIGLIFIWAGQIKDAAFSLAAVAVALVIGTKELILCFLGGMLKSGSRAFRIGDRIEVAGYRGDVIDMNFFTTIIFEIGPKHILHQYTGRRLTIPNSLFLNNPVSNESFTSKYFFHTFTIPIDVRDDWDAAKRILLEQANEECKGFLEDARRYMTRIGHIEGLDTPSVNPRVSVHVPTPDEVQLLVRIPSPPHRQGPMEQAIIERFLRDIAKIKKKTLEAPHAR